MVRKAGQSREIGHLVKMLRFKNSILRVFLVIFLIFVALLTSTQVSVAQTADTTPPQGSITSPVAESVLSGTVTVEVDATDNVGVAYVWVLADGQPWIKDSTPPYQVQWDTTKAVDGRRAVNAQAYDTAGNYINMRTYVNVSNGTPTPSSTPTASLSSSPTPTTAPPPGGCSGDFASMSSSQLLSILPSADYYCTESIAQALAPLSDNSVMESLLSMINTSAQSLARRNAIRVIGRFAGFPSTHQANILVKSTFSTEIKSALIGRLQNETAENVLHDAIWVLDSFFFPYYESQPYLETISKNINFSSSLRFRAIVATTRLIHVKTGIISDYDLQFLFDSLKSDDYWIRSQVAFEFEIINSNKLTDSVRAQIISELQTAYQAEQVLTAKVYIARALDRFNGNTALFDGLRNNYEATYLANQISEGSLTVRSGLSQSQLPAFLTKMQNEEQAFLQIIDPELRTPIPNDKNENLTLILFATRQAYQDYMNSFVGFGASSGGLYLTDEAKIYTYQRTSSESIFTVEELIQHEFTHFLTDRYIFPGSWGSSGYFNEAKAWADEGMAEHFAGMMFDSGGNFATPLRKVHLDKICSQSFRDLPSLLSQTEGYNNPGVFDYNNGWAFTHYLLTNRQAVANNLLKSFRNNTYDLDNFASIAGVSSVASLEGDWHSAMQVWCDYGVIPTPTFTQILTPTPTPSDTTPPAVSITAPSGSTVRRNRTQTISANVTDTYGIQKAEFYVNNSLLCADTVSPYSCNWSVPSTLKAKYTILVKGFDKTGNSTSKSKEVTAK